MTIEGGDIVFKQRPKEPYGLRVRGEVLTPVGNLRGGERKYRVAWEDGTAESCVLEDLLQEAPDGQPFVWGFILATHVVGPYAIVESVRNKPANAKPDWRAEIAFHYYVSKDLSGEFRDTNHSAESLDRALVAAVAYRNEWVHRGRNCAANSRVAGYFMRSIGPDCDGAEA